METSKLPKIIGYLKLATSTMPLKSSHTQSKALKEFGSLKAWAENTIGELKFTADLFKTPITLSKPFIQTLKSMGLTSEHINNGQVEPDYDKLFELKFAKFEVT